MNLDEAKTLPAEVKGLGGFLTPVFCVKKRKNLIRSNPSSRSLCGILVLSTLQGCDMKDLNGPI
jgi:hypothetical protein